MLQRVLASLTKTEGVEQASCARGLDKQGSVRDIAYCCEYFHDRSSDDVSTENKISLNSSSETSFN